MLEITEGFDSIVIDTVYPGGAVLRAGSKPGTAILRVWIEGFAIPYEVTLRVIPFPEGVGFHQWQPPQPHLTAPPSEQNAVQRLSQLATQHHLDYSR